VISAYLDSLAAALSFDRALARAVRDEVEDHLHEAVAADDTGVGGEAERRAIARLGDPHVLAAQFAMVALAKQSRQLAIAILVVLVALFVTMKTRIAWYAFTQWTIAPEMKPITTIIASIDRHAFWLSVAVGIACWAYIASCRIPPVFGGKFRGQVRNFVVLCAVSICALLVAVVSDGVLTVLQLRGATWSTRAAIPIASMTLEAALAGALAVRIRNVMAHMARVAALTNMR
jgi:hypothetical protein